MAVSFATNLREILTNTGVTNGGPTQMKNGDSNLSKTQLKSNTTDEEIDFMDEEESKGKTYVYSQALNDRHVRHLNG